MSKPTTVSGSAGKVTLPLHSKSFSNLHHHAPVLKSLPTTQSQFPQTNLTQKLLLSKKKMPQRSGCFFQLSKLCVPHLIIEKQRKLSSSFFVIYHDFYQYNSSFLQVAQNLCVSSICAITNCQLPFRRRGLKASQPDVRPSGCSRQHLQHRRRHTGGKSTTGQHHKSSMPP